MTQKDCDPRCTGKCNKKRLAPITTANKGCDPKCTGRCSKKNAATSPTESLQPQAIGDYEKENELPVIKDKENNVPVTAAEEKKAPAKYDKDVQPKFLQPGEVKYIIMDLDGIVLDIEIVYQWVIEDLGRKYGIPSEEIQHIIDLQDEETAKKLCTDYNLPISPQDFMIEFRSTSVKHLANTPLMTGIENLMVYFSANEIPVAVASTSNREAFELKTRKHKQFFKQFCHLVLGGSDQEVDNRKPSPKIYEVCGSRFPSNPNPKEILVLEDAPEGVVAATGAQMNVVWFPNKYMNKENIHGALAILDSIEAFDPQQFGFPPMKRC